MPFTVIFDGPHKGPPLHMYNVTQSVGITGVNLKEDVRLIQVLMRMVFYDFPGTFPAPPGETGIDMDGRFGQHTHAHIRHFKALLRAAGRVTPADGKIDPFVGHPETSKTPNSHGIFVLHQLNHSAFQACAKNGSPGRFSMHVAHNLADPPVPQELRDDLSKKVVHLP